MNAIWFLSKERNLLICGFNRIVKDNKTELWVQQVNGSSLKVATGKQAVELEGALLDMVWGQSPAIITDGNGNFSSNINLGQENEEGEVE